MWRSRLHGQGWIAVCLLVCGTGVTARPCFSQPAATKAHGAVTGRVICSDTNGPARFASVMLQPVVSGSAKATPHDSSNQAHEISKVYETGLDGSFVIADVAPGDYYLIAEKQGYRTGTEVTREQMLHPTEELARHMAEVLTPVRVVAGRTTSVDTRVMRGASIAGTVRFDDGTPHSGASLGLWRRNPKGEWERMRAGLLNSYGRAGADDTGHFRFSGLPAGEYLVSTEVEVNSMTIDRAVNGDSESWISSNSYSINVYAADATHRRDAKPVKAADGESAEGISLVVPLTKLHAVSGVLAEDGSGRPINAGKLSVVFEDGTELASTVVTSDDGVFHLAFVPEGNYTIKVSDAREVVRTEIPNPPGEMPAARSDEKTLRRFGDASAPLVVTGEMSGVVISVPAQHAAGSQ